MTLLLLIGNTEYIVATESEPLVIVLDPGHDFTHGGASGNGLGETALNLKIAQYCYEELRTYENVKVYMTRQTNNCPYPEACGVDQGARKDNLRRVEFANSVGADAYVALHLNSFSDPSIGGAAVFVPNYNYRPEVGKKGQALGNAILQELLALGLGKQGLSTRLSEDGTRYDDGSVADYYGVIKKAKDYNMPGIIVEHCFISNPTEAANYLSTEEQLKSLGVADATGIAKYYGLTKGGEGHTPEPTETFHTVKFVKNGKLVSTQYVRDGYSARPLEEKELEIKNVTYYSSLEGIKQDTVIEIDYELDPKQDSKPESKPESNPELESESESETQTESESESEGNAETEEQTESEVITDTQTGIDTEHKGTSFPWEIPVGIGCVIIAVAAIVAAVWCYKKRY